MKALITGTSAGIGRACAELFLQRGWHVFGFDIAPASIAHAEYEHFVVDVRDRAAFPAGLEQMCIRDRLYSVRSESGFVEPAPFKRDAFKRDVFAASGAELFEST